MHESIVSTAQLTMDASADARAILAYRKRLKGSDSERLQTVSINDLVLYAVSRVLRDYPDLNATFSGGVVRAYDQVDLGFAVDTPRGLMVPVVRAADRRSLAGIAEEAHRLARGCLEGGVNPDELSGGTFTVTNLGAFGIERFTPVLNVPQVAILGVCAITQRPAPDGEGSVPMMGFSLTIDHQVVDGAPAARFLQALTHAVSQIDLTLAE
jgi:pyruvate dehydrogenase E2 component (dihydrolipoamide acetyltransferase)